MMSRCCCKLFQRLVDAGHSLVVIEHNLEVIKCADWIIDLGPEAGDEGGEVVAAGTPEEIAQVERSHTGKFLREVLAKVAGRCGHLRAAGTIRAAYAILTMSDESSSLCAPAEEPFDAKSEPDGAECSRCSRARAYAKRRDPDPRRARAQSEKHRCRRFRATRWSSSPV